ncbi:MAG: hypothetical protein N2450_00245 [bacterium]|nr:hypothetical protein [bacterium]
MNPFVDRENPKKGIGCLNIFLLILFAIAIVQFAFVERLIGRYLAKTNFDRPLAGQAWTSGVEKELAAGKSSVAELSVGVRGDLAQWLIRAQRGRPSTLTLSRFGAQWQKIPNYLTTEVIPSSEWQNLVTNDVIERVRPTIMKKNITLTFLSSDNRVIAKYTTSENVMKRIAEHNKTLNDSIQKVSENIEIITPERWKLKWKNLPPEMKQLLWNVIQEDMIIHRPVGKYGIIPLDNTYSVLWIEFYQPQLICISYVLPIHILNYFSE